MIRQTVGGNLFAECFPAGECDAGVELTHRDTAPIARCSFDHQWIVLALPMGHGLDSNVGR